MMQCMTQFHIFHFFILYLYPICFKSCRESFADECGEKECPGTIFLPDKEDKPSKDRAKEVKIVDANKEKTMYKAPSAHSVHSKEVETSNREIEKAVNNASPLTVSPITSSGK